jgi:hypothetical protein
MKRRTSEGYEVVPLSPEREAEILRKGLERERKKTRITPGQRRWLASMRRSEATGR